MPTSGASTSSSSGDAPMRSCRPRRRRGSTASTPMPEAFLEAAPHALGAARQPRRAGDQHAREAAAVQAILVIHRRLVNQVRERPLASSPRLRKNSSALSRMTASVR